MGNIQKIAVAICAVSLCAGMAGCSKGNSSSTTEKTQSKADTSSQAVKKDSETDESAATTSEIKQVSQVGEHLKAVYDIYQQDNYTLDCTITASDFEGTIELTRVVRGDDVYQLQQETMGRHGAVTVEGVSYDFDYVCGMYRKATGEPDLNIVSQIVDLNLAQTTGNDDSSESEYIVEEYTYTGDTYITIMDFYFDKDDGGLVKYETTYSVEGQDDITETREIKRLDNEIDESVFNTDFIYSLVDFNSMSEDQRLGFCQGLCASFGVSTDDMYNMDITTDQFKTIGYEQLFKLIYTYGKGHMY